jgi:hypothetical protein
VKQNTFSPENGEKSHSSAEKQRRRDAAREEHDDDVVRRRPRVGQRADVRVAGREAVQYGSGEDEAEGEDVGEGVAVDLESIFLKPFRLKFKDKTYFLLPIFSESIAP